MEHKIKESWVSESLHRGKLAPDKEPWHSAAPWAKHQFYRVQPLKFVGAFVIAVYSLGFSRKQNQYDVCIYLFTEIYFKELAHIIMVDGKVKIRWLGQQAEI